MKTKLRKKSFWLSLAAGVTLLLQLLGVRVDAPYVNEVVCVVCGLMMLLGVLVPDGQSEVFGYPLISDETEHEDSCGDETEDVE